MLTEKFLEKALTGLLSDTVQEQAHIFFAALRNSDLCSEDEVAELEREWQALIEQRREEGAGAAESLAELLGKLQARRAPAEPSGEDSD